MKNLIDGRLWLPKETTVCYKCDTLINKQAQTQPILLLTFHVDSAAGYLSNNVS